MSDQQSSQADFIVIGAGMAGLAAAATLRASGKTVIVLEAQDRIGGRIYTDRSIAPIPVELGAELIHTTQSETWALVRSAGLQTLELAPAQFKQHGAWHPLLDTDTNLSLDLTGHPHPTSQESIADYLQRIGIAPKALPFELRLFELDTESSSKMGAWELAQRIEKLEREDEAYGEHDFRVLGGYDQLIAELTKGLDIRLNHPAEKIDWSRGMIEVTISNGHRFYASKAIITLPLGVLQARAVTFMPDLPKKKWRAIDALGICDIVKIHVVLDKPIFPNPQGSIVDEASQPPIWWDASSGYADFKGQVLVGWAAGDNARLYMQMNELDATAHALLNLQATLGLPSLKPRAIHIYHWNNNPYIRGAYSYNPPGSIGSREELARPLKNTLFFAGEATDDWYGSVQGAYRSGQRTAQEALHQPLSLRTLFS